MQSKDSMLLAQDTAAAGFSPSSPPITSHRACHKAAHFKPQGFMGSEPSSAFPRSERRDLLLVGAVRRLLLLASAVAKWKAVTWCSGDGSCDHLDQSISLPSEIQLRSGLFEVGRESPADIVVAVPTVSTRHAMLRLENNKVSVTDLGSTNGTYIDDEELAPLRAVEMSVGTEITFGDMFLAKFKLEERD